LKHTLAWPGALQHVPLTDEHGYDYALVPVIPEKPTAEQSAAIETARREIERLCEPAQGAQVAQELAKLRVTMARRDATITDEKAMLFVYLDDIGEFPSDIVRDACKAWRRREKWFPTPAELREECHKRARVRFKWRAALRDVAKAREEGAA
jgi:hypothetical protein